MTSLRNFAALALLLAAGACTDAFVVNVPQWPNGGSLDQTRALTSPEMDSIEGVYVVTKGNSAFGDTVVLRWNGAYLAVYAGVHTAYMVMQSGATYDTTAGDSVIYSQGYWRYQNAENTGLVSFTTPLHRLGSFTITGAFGNGGALPSSPVTFTFLRPISAAAKGKRFYIISHHGSGGAPELLPASENSVEIIKIIERFGANGIEVDTRPTKDSIPILYHDNTLNPRLVQKGPLEGPVENYTFAQLSQYVRLVRGERIPTLKAALDSIITSTNMEFVYVDLKPSTIDFLPEIVAVQAEALAKADSLGRNVQIYLALTTDTLVTRFLTLPKFDSIPTLCELSLAQLAEANSLVWSPRFTEGIPTSDINMLHGENKQAITWTVNADQFLQTFISEGLLDGVLTDYPTLAAYYFWKQ